MSTVREILTDAYDWLNVTNEGRPAMTAREGAKGLRALKSLYLDLIEKADNLQTVVVTGDYTAGENQRIVNNSGGDVTITLPVTLSGRLNNPRYSDVVDDVVDNTVRPPTDFAIVVVTGNPPTTNVYDANLDTWVEIESLTLEDEAPWSQFLGFDLAAMTAKVLTRFGGQIDDICDRISTAGYLRILTRLQSSGADDGSVFMSPDRMRM